MNLKKILRGRFLSFECFLHGDWNENPEYHTEKWERERIEYAKKNPWVLKYDFGHKELIEKYTETVI